MSAAAASASEASRQGLSEQAVFNGGLWVIQGTWSHPHSAMGTLVCWRRCLPIHQLVRPVTALPPGNTAEE